MIGPPAGQDGSPPPSEFLTPVRPYETIDPEPGAWPASDPAPAIASAPRRGAGVGVAVAAVVLVAAGLVWIVTDRSSSTSLDAPVVTATADVCAAPDCERLEARVTLSWSVSGDDVDAFQILRGGRVLGNVGADATAHRIDGLRIERAYVFGVRAVLDGEPGEVGTVRIRTPAPPLAEAQLTGSYRIRETVRSASNLSVVEGIENPRPGSTIVQTWAFDALCEPQAGACATAWFSWGPLVNSGTRYDGSFRSRPATCGGSGRVPTTTEMHLVTSSARTIDDRWRVDRFRGSLRVRFRCPGGGSSLGVLHVQGRALI